MIIQIVIGCFGGDIIQVTNQIRQLLSNEKKTRAILNKTVSTVLFESESITTKVLSGLIQEQ